MLKNEWKALRSNWIMLVVMAAVVAIPTIYTTLFLGSMWDPYGNVDRLPVAVVNEDEPVEYGGKTLSIGSELADNLREDGSLDFHFVDAGAARQGLADGTYYMVITIPKDFSACAATVTDDAPRAMELAYETNPGTNYIASKLGESAMARMEAQVRESVTRTYAETLLDQLTDIGDGLREGADGAAKLEAGAGELAGGGQTIRENLKLLADSTLTFRSGSTTLSEGLAKYTAGVDAAAQGAAKLKTGADQLAQGAGQLGAAAPALAEGAGKLGQGAQELAAGVNSAKAGGDTLAAGAAQVDDKLTELNGGLAQLQTQTAALPDSAAALDAGAQQALAGATELQSGLQAASAGANTAREGAAQLNDGLQALAGKSAALNDGAAALAQGLEELEALAAQTPVLPSESAAVLTQLQQAATGLKQNLGTYTAGVDTAATGAAALNDASTGLTALADGLSQMAGKSAELTGGLTALQQGTAALAQQAPLLAQGIDQAAQGGQKLQDEGTKVVRQGAQDLSGGLEQLAGGSAALQTGLGDLSAKLPALTDGLTRLQTGAGELQQGAGQLASGTGELQKNSAALNSGAAALADGAARIGDGASKLYEGSGELTDGLDALKEGSATLGTSLSDGARQIAETNTGKEVAGMIAAPVSAEETKLTEVPDNGHAMAPYMMSVALWVGCIAFSLMYPLTEYQGELKSGAAWWLSKASVLYPVALLQAVVMVGALHALNGFDPARMGRALLIACLAAVTFMSVMYFFTSLLGRIGSFLMLVFMVVQLAGSVGTYPLEISGSFVKYLHGWVPFTYTVKAFRSAICAGQDVTGCAVYLALWALAFTLMTLAVFAVRAKRIRAGRPTLTPWLERHRLA